MVWPPEGRLPMTEDYLRYYNLEAYLFEDVRQRFFRDGKLDAFDLFSIIIWKANRSKSKLARRLIKKCGDLQVAASTFTTELFNAPSPEARLLVAMTSWGFYLPMASSVLSVLWPDEFTIYDVRVCDELGGFHSIGKLGPNKVWPKYCDYRAAVVQAVPADVRLRDKDRFLWGRSAARQLVRDIQQGFPIPAPRGQ
jgi:hypothetical protein